MNPKAKLALVALLAAVGIGVAVWQRTPADDLQHATAAAPPCDGGLCVFGPNRCQFVTARGSGLGVEVPDTGSGLLLLKQCFHRCEFDGGIEVQIGEREIPCREPLYDGGPERCVDGGIPIMRDLCTEPFGIPELPPGVETLEATWARDYLPGEAPTEVWTAEHPEAPWKCACGGPGFDGDAGPCRFRNDDFLDGGIVIERVIEASGPIPAQTVVIHAKIPNGKKWEKPDEDHAHAKPGDWKGNCRRMPCGTWSGMSPTPVECRGDEFKGLECGMGKAGKRLSGDQQEDDAGHPMTCVGNKWVPSLDPAWECGEGRWYREQKPCPAPTQDPDAGLCYKAKCQDHLCNNVPVNCKKLSE